jgi:hypothetical protein
VGCKYRNQNIGKHVFFINLLMEKKIHDPFTPWLASAAYMTRV